MGTVYRCKLVVCFRIALFFAFWQRYVNFIQHFDVFSAFDLSKFQNNKQ